MKLTFKPVRASRAEGFQGPYGGSQLVLTLYRTFFFFQMCNCLPKRMKNGDVRIFLVYYSLKDAVYTVWIFICICMSLRVFLFSKKMKFLTKGGIHCISQVFPWHFCFMREHSLVELTEHDDSAANIIVHSTYTCMYCCIHSTY